MKYNDLINNLMLNFNLYEFRKTMQEAVDYYKLNVSLDSDCVFDWE